MKKCSKCKIEKGFDSFNKSKSNKDGLHYVCKDCRKKERINKDDIKNKNNEYYKNNKDILLIKNKEYRLKNKEKLTLMSYIRPCCDASKPAYNKSMLLASNSVAAHATDSSQTRFISRKLTWPSIKTTSRQLPV